MSGANSTQIGGDHYKGRIEPWDYIVWNEIGFLEGSVIKYVTRARRKNGAEDYAKAGHFLQKLIECTNTSNAGTRRVANTSVPITNQRIKLDDFARSNELTPQEKDVVHLVTIWDKRKDLEAAATIIQAMIDGNKTTRPVFNSETATLEVSVVEPVPEEKKTRRTKKPAKTED